MPASKNVAALIDAMADYMWLPDDASLTGQAKRDRAIAYIDAYYGHTEWRSWTGGFGSDAGANTHVETIAFNGVCSMCGGRDESTAMQCASAWHVSMIYETTDLPREARP